MNSFLNTELIKYYPLKSYEECFIDFGKTDICRFLTSDLPISGSWLDVALYRSKK